MYPRNPFWKNNQSERAPRVTERRLVDVSGLGFLGSGVCVEVNRTGITWGCICAYTPFERIYHHDLKNSPLV